MRHWRSALQQIYDHHANKVIPGYGPQSDTEKALFDAIKQLELQCKERIDLLEALRASRQEEGTPDPTPKLTKPSPSPYESSSSKGKGTIGLGTIPAVTYSELSRPTPSPRPLPPRPPPEPPYTHYTSSPERLSTPNFVSRSRSPSASSKKDKSLRAASPEKHTMRTTLRSKNGEKTSSSSSSRKPAKPAAEGPSKAATLAWSALGIRDRHSRATSSDAAANSVPLSKPASDSFIKPPRAHNQWDSSSRRLVTGRPSEPPTTVSPRADVRRSSEGRRDERSSSLSVSAASSAIHFNSTYGSPPSDNQNRNSDFYMASRAAQAPGRWQKGDSSPSSGTADEQGPRTDKVASEAVMRRKALARRAAVTSVSSQPEPSLPSRPKQRPPVARARSISSTSGDERAGNSSRPKPATAKKSAAATSKATKTKKNGVQQKDQSTDGADQSSSEASEEESSEDKAWKKKKAAILKSLPPGVDEGAAKQILNDIVVQGDEVRWDDIAGLEIAKNALRETVVYPFLRPDLFMGLREPARGMLLFGPPGTGKTMLARAVATESRSTFFSISASSLTSKYLGESEKLVRALFGLARCLAPSIIFVDEIDSLLSQRSGSGEHEATRRIKTEFLIQWSDLQRAAAGRETTERDKERGDANRVLVLAATNLPWAIDEAARRRFVRRQYIPLPEPSTRETQFRTLLGQQKHSLSNGDITRLVELTDGTYQPYKQATEISYETNTKNRILRLRYHRSSKGCRHGSAAISRRSPAAHDYGRDQANCIG